jgi:hypothetical protein
MRIDIRGRKDAARRRIELDLKAAPLDLEREPEHELA